MLIAVVLDHVFSARYVEIKFEGICGLAVSVLNFAYWGIALCKEA